MTSSESPRAALVTGAARGIGAAVAAALAADGHAVVVADLRGDEAAATAERIVAGGGRAVAVTIDVVDRASVDAAVVTAEEAFGSVDILVNCAGWDDLKPFVATDEDLWDRVVEINYKGVLRTTHATLPGMIERGYGRIVNIGSDAGRVGSSMEAVYAGAKAGVVGFTKTIARETARKGVTANVVCPGPTDTQMLRDIVASSGPDADKVIAAMTAAVPMKRLGKPEEIAAAVRFFVREDAAFITGQTLSVSGGLTMA